MSIVDIYELLFSPSLVLYYMFPEIQACSDLLHCILHPVIQFTVGCDAVKLYCSLVASISYEQYPKINHFYVSVVRSSFYTGLLKNVLCRKHCVVCV
jgi:hypothetical protein